MSIKNLSKLLNRIYSNKKIMDSIISSSETVNEIDRKMAEIMKYYIVTRDNKVRSYDFITKRIDRCQDYIVNRKKGQLKFEAYFNNCILDGVVTHAFNGYNLDKVKRYGLGDERIFDKELTKNLQRLEEDLGSSEYVLCQSSDTSEIYYSGVGDTSFYYACYLSPERLYLGPLEGFDNEQIILGESKYNFMLRVLKNKIYSKCNINEQSELVKVAEDVISKLCTKKPVIALIPIQRDDFELNASDASAKDNMKSLSEYLIKNINLSARRSEDGKLKYDPILGSRFDVFTENYWEVTNLDNLVSRGVRVPPKYLNFVIVPDDFELTQRLALSKGCNKGDKIDYHYNTPSSIVKINYILPKETIKVIKNSEKVENFEKKEKNISVRKKLKKVLQYKNHNENLDENIEKE